MARRPIIGITPSPSTSEQQNGTFYRYCLSDTYVRSVHRAGGIPIILPWVGDDPTAVLETVDGLVISGGGDIAPDRFGQALHARTKRIDARRDAFEIALVRAAVERDLPTLAICRGIQVMAVAFGGTLHQHVPDVSADLEHRQHEAGYTQHQPSHRVLLENTPNPVSELLGKTELMANSHHHQAVAEVPEPLRVAGRAEDGAIEAIWHPGMAFGIGVQWHPEMLAWQHEDHARFFRALVSATGAMTAATA